jgi:hypothetical protein
MYLCRLNQLPMDLVPRLRFRGWKLWPRTLAGPTLWLAKPSAKATAQAVVATKIMAAAKTAAKATAKAMVASPPSRPANQGGSEDASSAFPSKRHCTGDSVTPAAAPVASHVSMSERLSPEPMAAHVDLRGAADSPARNNKRPPVAFKQRMFSYGLNGIPFTKPFDILPELVAASLNTVFPGDTMAWARIGVVE